MISTEFSSRVAVVTGGSDGLGLDFCKKLVEAGCEVFFCARNAQRGAAAAELIGQGAHYFQVDVAEAEQLRSFADHVRQALGKVDYLVNNVAVDDRIPFGEVDEEQADRMWQVNLRSYILTTRLFLDLLRAGEGKSIVNIVTTNYMMGNEAMTLYNAAKSGIIGFTRSLARELGREGIRANMVTPGWIMTEKQLREYVSEEDKTALVREQALKFLLYPEHVTPPVLFFLSSAASAITGQNLVVDGGKVMQ